MKRILFAAMMLLAINAVSFGQTTAKAKDAHKAAPAQKTAKAEPAKANPNATVTSVSPQKKDAVADTKHKTHKKKEKTKSKK